MALLLAACASQPKKEEVFVAEFVQRLQGSYDTIAQARSNPGRLAVRLMVAPVHAPRIGDHVFYVQEIAADDVRRVLSQKMYVVNAVPRSEQALLTQLDLAEPLRWRDGHLNRDLFVGMQMQDVRARPGCDLLWEREADVFVAGGGASCRTSAPGTGETLRVEQRMRLDEDGLEVFEQHRDAAGELVYGGGADPWNRYARRADKPW
jgi:hypothetical protein